MKKIILSISLFGAAASAPVFADDSSTLTNQDDRVSYALGMTIGQSIKQLDTDSIKVNEDILMRGFHDFQSGGKTLLSATDQRQVMTELQQTVRMNQQKQMAELGAKNKAEGEAFLAANAKNPGVVTLPDGLQYQILSAGTGPMPTAADSVTVNYNGTLINGTEFDSSYKRGKPATFPVTGVIPGWTEAIQKMPVGSKWKLFIPASLAYGAQGRPGIPPNAALIFQVELLSINPPAPPMSAPPAAPLTSDIIKVPSAEEMKKGAKIEVIKPEDAQKMQQSTTN